MKTQIWIGESGYAPTEERFNPVTNNPEKLSKPRGGLWTSTLRDDGTSAWVEWIRREQWVNVGNPVAWRLEPRVDHPIDVYEIDSYDDLRTLIDLYASRREQANAIGEIFAQFNWSAVADDYDAVHLTERGERETRYPGPERPSLYGWDCESTIHLRWNFDGAESLGPLDITERPETPLVEGGNA